MKQPMQPRRAKRLAWTLFIATLVCAAGSFALIWLSRSAPVLDVIGFRGFDAVLAVAFAAVGAVVVARRPSNPVGWLLFAFGASNAPISLVQQYAFFAIVGRPSFLPGGAIAAWAQEWVAVVQGALFVLLLLLFPTGRLPSRRWLPVAILAIAGSALEAVGGALSPEPIATFRTLDNPFGLMGTPAAVVQIGDQIGNVLFMGTILAAVASVIVRYRRAEHIERLQLKWIAVAAALVGVGLVGFTLTGQEAGSSVYARPVQIFFILAIMGVPVAAGIAILRYRLYNIERIISRTLSYAVVTVLLGGTFALVVLVPTALVGSRARTPDWLVAIATLVVAALFRPVRRRVQSGVDRRFNRGRYDAELTVQSFAQRLREQLDIDTLTAELVGVVDQTVHPASTTLWLRKS